ncbi:hypothetical protein [Halobellus sp. GM3]|uniref:hypothetical protein n=1 Tax=Halobellus sp. GM3 TaxID=3458410 RepID=UPI00403E26FC
MNAERVVRLSGSTLRTYSRFSRYNSPYPAHDSGCAVDLYPATNEAASPVAGDVIETKTVRAPAKPYAADEEYLVLVDVDAGRSDIDVVASGADNADADDLIARVLHVRPTVEPGDTIGVGDPIGELVRSGFFAPWVENHLHVGFRRVDQNPYRAGGSLPVVADVAVEPLPWDGVGTVVDAGETYALLDAPRHPAQGDRFAGIAASADVGDGCRPPDAGEASTERALVALDGGVAHYAGGGVLTGTRPSGGTGAHGGEPGGTGAVSFLGHPIGDRTGRNVAWRDIDVLANGERITGLSLFVGFDAACGAKLVCPDREFETGDRVRVTIRDSDDPVRLG